MEKEKKEILTKLLPLIKAICQRENKLSEIAEFLQSNKSPDIYNSFLDFIGIPAETYHHETNPEGFCRDWYSDMLFEYTEGTISLDKTIKKLLKE